MKAILALLILAAGLLDTPQTVGDLDSKQDQSQVVVSGLLHGQFDEAFKLFQLCPDEGTTSLKYCLDLIVPDDLAPEYITLNGQCVVARGKFIAFGDRRVGMGNLSSSIGVVRVTSIAACN